MFKQVPNKILLYLLFVFGAAHNLNAQVNYINNPSFEMRCGSDTAYYWSAFDSSACANGGVFSFCSSSYSLPAWQNGFQYPKSGNSFLLNTAFVFNNSDFQAYYIKNRLKAPLQLGKIYCVKYFLNTANSSTWAYDAYDLYFGNSSDSISGKWPCWQPITFLSPQVSNPANNIISDTLNWVAMTGTFTSTGGEKYLVFGNLRGANVNILSIYTNSTYPNFQDVCLDDFSVVDIDLPADAGPDKHFFVGDSVYIGRPLDVGTDYACTWYQLPFTNIPMPGVSGMWVKPVQTTTFVVAQQLWCSGVKYDTVVVYRDAVGIKDLEVYVENVQLFPNPVADKLNIQISQQSIGSSIKQFTAHNQLGQTLAVPINLATGDQWQLDCSDLSAGVYYLRFELESGGSFAKRFVVER